MTRVPLPPDHNDTDEKFPRGINDYRQISAKWDRIEKKVGIWAAILSVIFLLIVVYIKYA